MCLPSLRSYTCLTTGDVFPVNYNSKVFEFEVMETRPGPAISVVETDCEVSCQSPHHPPFFAAFTQRLM